MRVLKDPAGFRLSLNLFEGRLLRQCLAAIRKNYLTPPEQAEGRLVQCWYSARGCEQAGMSGEDIRQWQHDLHQVRLANLQLVKRWEEQLAKGSHGRYEVALPEQEAASFLTVINDHRLLVAVQQNIGEEEMEMHSLRQISKLASDKQAALYEIHLLAYLMEELLALLTK